MLHRLLILLIFFSFQAFAQYGEISVKTWADDKKSAFTFTLDDGLASQVQYGNSVLSNYGFQGTFMVITDHITEEPPGEWRYTTWNSLRELNYQGHEIGAHSLNHPDLVTLPLGDTLTPGTAMYEIYFSGKKINEKITSQSCFSFAYPLSSYNDTVCEITAQYYEAARGAGTSPNAFNLSEGDWVRLKSVPPLFDMPRNTLSDDLPELEIHKALVDSAILQGGWTISMLHEIVPQAELQSVINLGLWNPISSEWLDLLCSWLNEKSLSGDVWVSTMKDVSKYIKERSSFSSTVNYQSAGEISIDVTDEMNDEIYNYPLTVDITVPEDWVNVRIIQGTRSSVSETFQSDGKFYVRTEVIPDGGELILLKQDNSGVFSINGEINYHYSGMPVNNAIVVASGNNNFQASAVTNPNGTFSISSIPPGTYNISILKTDEFTGVNATDALHILKHISGQMSFDTIQQRAADVDNSSQIDSTDASFILERYIHLRDRFISDDWLFFPEDMTVEITDSNAVIQIKAIKSGDVSD